MYADNNKDQLPEASAKSNGCSWEHRLVNSLTQYSGRVTKLFKCPSDQIQRTEAALAVSTHLKSYRCNGYLWADANSSCLKGAYMKTKNRPSQLISLICQPHSGMCSTAGRRRFSMSSPCRDRRLRAVDARAERDLSVSRRQRRKHLVQQCDGIRFNAFKASLARKQGGA